MKKLSTILPLFILICLLSSPAAGDTVEHKPFTIIKTSQTSQGLWEVHLFTLLPPGGKPDTAWVSNYQNSECSIIDYSLFKAHNTMAFQEGMESGLADEIARRDHLKRTTDFGAYLYCAPFWPFHLAWELPLAGAEKERSLDKSAMTIILPEAGLEGIGEIPCDQPISVDLNTLGGVGTEVSFFAQGKVSIPVLFPGWGSGERGDIIVLVETSKGRNPLVRFGDGPRSILAGKSPGRYEWPFERAVIAFSKGDLFFGYRVMDVNNGEHLEIEFISDENRSVEVFDNTHRQENPWPEPGKLDGYKAISLLLSAGIILNLSAFLLINHFLMKINFQGKLHWVLRDSSVVFLIVLTFSTILLPFLGLGWVAGSYAAARYLSIRHELSRTPWFPMLALTVLAASAYELAFMRLLWL